MSNRVVIADTSGLIALSNIGELSLLKSVSEEILITPEVGKEFGEQLPSWKGIWRATPKLDFNRKSKGL